MRIGSTIVRMTLFLSTIRMDPDAVVDRDTFPFTIPALRNFSHLELNSRVTFLVGENGSGKSTLLEGIAVARGFSAEGGTVNHRFQTVNSHSTLHDALLCNLRPAPSYGFFLRAESLYNFFSHDDQLTRETGKSGRFTGFHRFSHGESFLEAIKRLPMAGLYIFDEPEAALSPRRLLQFMFVMQKHVAKGSQFLIATHSPILLAFPGARILSMDGPAIREIRYEETDHYTVTKSFLQSHELFRQEIRSADVDSIS